MLAFTFMGVYFLCLLRRNINFYSKWSIIFICIGLFLRMALFTIDLTLRLQGEPEGLLVIVNANPKL